MPHFRTIDLNGPLYNQLSGDTFEFVNPSESACPKGHSEQTESLVVDAVREILFPSGPGSNQDQDAIFDNMVGFYEISDTEDGLNSGQEDDIIA